MTYVAEKESSLYHKAIGDLYIEYKDGKNHSSRGIIQINSYFYPDVTDEQAFDVDFSLNFLAQHLKDGKCSRWTTCRQYVKKYDWDM